MEIHQLQISEKDQEIVRGHLPALREAFERGETTLQLQTPSPESEPLSLPKVAVDALRRVLESFEQSTEVCLLSLPSEIGISDTADVLNVSKSYVRTLVEEKKLMPARDGLQLTFHLGDVLALKKDTLTKSKEQLDKITRLSEEFGLYE